MLKGKRSTQMEKSGVCIIQVVIAWVGSVSSIYYTWYVIFDDLNTSTGWGLHDLHELHIHVNQTCMCRDQLMNSFVWVGPRDLKDLYGLQGLYNVDTPVLAARSAWSV